MGNTVQLDHGRGEECNFDPNFSLNLGRIYERTFLNQLSPQWESPDRRSPFDVYSSILI